MLFTNQLRIFETFFLYFTISNIKIMNANIKSPEVDFVVIKKSFYYAQCSACNGTGQYERAFRSMHYVSNCTACYGTGRIKHSISEEVSLVDALRNIYDTK